MLLLPALAGAAPVAIPFDSGFTAIEPIVGAWEQVPDKDAPQLAVRGDKWEQAPEAGAAAKLGRIFKGLPESALDQIKAYSYFPLALVRDREFSAGDLRVEVQPVSGEADRAGGIAFGMSSPSSSWVLRLNAREDNVMLFEYDLPRKVSGRFGLWSKADSRTLFRRFSADCVPARFPL